MELGALSRPSLTIFPEEGTSLNRICQLLPVSHHSQVTAPTRHASSSISSYRNLAHSRACPPRPGTALIAYGEPAQNKA